MWFFKKKRVEKPSTLIPDAIKQLDRIQKRKFKKNSLTKLNKLIRIFLKEEFHISRASTIEEANKELKNKKELDKKIKTKIISLTEKIRNEEFLSKDPFTKEKLHCLIEETRAILNLIPQKQTSS